MSSNNNVVNDYVMIFYNNTHYSGVEIFFYDSRYCNNDRREDVEAYMDRRRAYHTYRNVMYIISYTYNIGCNYTRHRGRVYDNETLICASYMYVRLNARIYSKYYDDIIIYCVYTYNRSSSGGGPRTDIDDYIHDTTYF